MATTSYLYHCFNLSGYVHLRTEYTQGEVYHHVELQREKRRCRGCQASWRYIILAGRFTRTFRALPLGRRSQHVVLHGHEQQCRRCHKVFREPISFADGKQRHLRAFKRFVIDLCSLMPIKHVARYLRVGWDTIKNIHKSYLANKADHRSFGKVRYLAVDEFAIRKGHTYLTIAMDLESGAVLFANENRDEQALVPFLLRLKRSKAPLRAVAIDMWRPFMNAIKTVFGSEVDIVHDPYHIVMHANKALDQVRRDMVSSLEGEERTYIKGTRYLLLKGLEKLSHRAVERLGKLMALNAPLYAAYLLKEELRTFWLFRKRHPHENGDPANELNLWVPAFARMTNIK